MKPFRDMTEPELRTFFHRLARTIENRLPPGPGPRGRCPFVLLVADESQIGQYVGNVERRSVIELLRETANRLERGEDVPR